MKIVIRHGRIDHHKLIQDNFFSLLSDDGIRDILEARKKIQQMFTKAGRPMPKKVYCSWKDRGIETALLLLENGEKLLENARLELSNNILAGRHVARRRSDFYMAVGPRDFDGVTMDSALETHVPERILAVEDVIIVVHQPAAESVGLKLEVGQFKKIALKSAAA